MDARGWPCVICVFLKLLEWGHHRRFWIRENIPIRMYVKDYEQYGSQARLVGKEISWADVRRRIQEHCEKHPEEMEELVENRSVACNNLSAYVVVMLYI